MERVWGGKRLSTYGKSLPNGIPIGELWELVDREDVQSVVHSGPLRGKTLNTLWQKERAKIFGSRFVNFASSRFPLLFKLLDAHSRLSVQVHPPERIAAFLNGQPKTEMWYFLDADPGAKVYAGLKKGTTKKQFEELLTSGHVEEVLHEIPVQVGGSIFIPSGRVHAIGEHNVIVEIQQNSDTTFRVYDWNRLGLDGCPRQLHIHESLASIDFEDFEPRIQPPGQDLVADCNFFRVRFIKFSEPFAARDAEEFSIYTVVMGRVRCGGEEFPVGHFFLVPAELHATMIQPVNGEAAVLQTTLPTS
ncbi:MAG: mannose-6-phosphate isomerase [Verrucomicrobia bacterium]|nr:MAG: mannose-6-phosphate isomerase [Verrucomicrobiota bacterium]